MNNPKTIAERVAELDATFDIIDVTGTDEAAALEPFALRGDQVLKLVATDNVDSSQLVLSIFRWEVGRPTPDVVEFFRLSLIAAIEVTRTFVPNGSDDESFRAWCDSLGYDSDSRRRYQEWEANCDLTNRLGLWLGNRALFAQWLRETTDLPIG
jgi:hypothetical protein